MRTRPNPESDAKVRGPSPREGSARRSFARWRSALLAVAATISGGTAACQKAVYPACKKDKQCEVSLGEKCIDQQCQNCFSDADCSDRVGLDGVAHDRCIDLRCQTGSTTASAGTGGVGSPCTDSAACSSGLVCTEGVCGSCTSNEACAGGSCSQGRCGNAGGSCGSDDECAMDEICDAGSCVFSGSYASVGVRCEMEHVFFAFDSPKLDAAALETLEMAAACLADQRDALILEAHADPRGTEEYNILLTDLRGRAVAAYLEGLGVPRPKITVIAKGSLEAVGTDERSWAQDRRVDFIWTAASTSP